MCQISLTNTVYGYPFLPISLQLFICQLEFPLGLESQPSSKNVVGIVNEKLLDRYLLADTVFRMFGGKIDGLKPDRMPDGEYNCVLGCA